MRGKRKESRKKSNYYRAQTDRKEGDPVQKRGERLKLQKQQCPQLPGGIQRAPPRSSACWCDSTWNTTISSHHQAPFSWGCTWPQLGEGRPTARVSGKMGPRSKLAHLLWCYLCSITECQKSLSLGWKQAFTNILQNPVPASIATWQVFRDRIFHQKDIFTSGKSSIFCISFTVELISLFPIRLAPPSTTSGCSSLQQGKTTARIHETIIKPTVASMFGWDMQ